MTTLEPGGLYDYQSPTRDPTAAFHAYFESNKACGTVGEPSVEINDSNTYLPEDAQKQYFTVERVEQICTQLYPEARGYDVVPAQNLQGPYHQVFATLLYIGKGELIQRFLSNPDLQDTHLPFLQKPIRFPGDDEDFARFFEAQWKFCAPVMVYYQGVDWQPRQILPFKCLKKLNEGSSGKAYLIDVHPFYDRISGTEPPATADAAAYAEKTDELKQANAVAPHLYVLKVFRPSRQKSKAQWQREAKAHVSVRTNKELTKDDGIVKFHGCFSQGRIFSILLEYASIGNLEQLFRTTLAPTDMVDILDLWKSYLRLLRTLHCLRRMQYADGSTYQMCHFDIKPNNVLVFPGESGRPCDLIFKLGDLGSSVHCALLDEGEAYALQSPGTRTYGAPECCRSDPMSDSSLPPNHVLPPSDLWSFGCIASELATWMLRGWGGLRQYRDGRKDCHDDPDFEDSDCFHSGYKTLPMVSRHHRRLREDALPCDATAAIIPLIDADMLQVNPDHRAEPKHLLYKAKEALNRVERMLPVASEVDTIDVRQSLAEPSSQAGLPSPSLQKSLPYTPARRSTKSDCTMPRDFMFKSEMIAEHTISPATESTRTGRYRSFSATQSLGIDPRQRMIARGARSTGSSNMRAEFAEHARPPLRSPSRLADGARRHHSTMYESQHYGRPRPLSGEYSKIDETPILPPRKSPNQNAFMFPDLADTTDVCAEPKSYEEHDEDWIPERRSKTRSKDMDAGSDEVESPTELTPVRSPLSKKLPSLSVDGAITWKDETKQPSRISKLFKSSTRDSNPHWDHLTHEFEDKDFIILVDDSPSMRTHWKEVGECAGLLAFCTTPYDDDGVELRYTNNEDKKRTKDPNTIAENVQKNKPRQPMNSSPPRLSNMNAALIKVLGKYKDKVEAKYGSGKRPDQKFKGLVLFVLTDGVWDECNAKEPIWDLVEVLKTCDRPKNLVGIQFIQFGEDPEGYRRLTELDDFMKKRDIVDLEPYPKGNFFKMLLGSINKAYDHSDFWFSASDRSDSPRTSGSATASPRASDWYMLPNSPPPRTRKEQRTLSSHTALNIVTPETSPRHRKASSRSNTVDGQMPTNLRGGGGNHNRFTHGFVPQY